MTVANAALLLLLVMDPFGNVPLFLSALKPVPRGRWRVVVARECLVALGILLLFLFFGRTLLAVMGISEPSLSVAGGILLFLIALRMVFPSPKHGGEEVPDGEPFIVPLATPLVAGPGAIATVILLGSGEPGSWPLWLAAVVLAWAASSAVLMMSAPIARVLGSRGLIAVERLMGMLTVAIAVEMTLGGVSKFMSQATGT